MKIKQGDFLEVEFVGRVKDTNDIFDLTNEKVAKEGNIYNKNFRYGARVICVGEGILTKGVENFLIGKEIGEYKVELSAENAFGKKDPRLIKIVSLGIFKNSEVKPFPGLQLNLDGLLGTVRGVSGGRVIIDFNHPLAGRDIVYDIKVNKIVKDVKEKVYATLRFLTGQDIKFEIKENKLEIKTEFAKEVQDIVNEKIKKLIPEVKEIIFSKDTDKK